MPWRLKQVIQEDDSGCAVACLAMVAGATYQAVASNFFVDLDKRGLTVGAMKEWLTQHGIAWIEKTRGEHLGVYLYEHNARMLKPFADVHIVTVQQKADLKHNHSFIM